MAERAPEKQGKREREKREKEREREGGRVQGHKDTSLGLTSSYRNCLVPAFVLALHVLRIPSMPPLGGPNDQAPATPN